jgi:hypothetical protein
LIALRSVNDSTFSCQHLIAFGSKVAFFSKYVFERNDSRHIDRIVDMVRKGRDGSKGYPHCSVFMGLLFMYLKNVGSVLELIRFIRTNPDWLLMS